MLYQTQDLPYGELRRLPDLGPGVIQFAVRFACVYPVKGEAAAVTEFDGGAVDDEVGERTDDTVATDDVGGGRYIGGAGGTS